MTVRRGGEVAARARARSLHSRVLVFLNRHPPPCRRGENRRHSPNYGLHFQGTSSDAFRPSSTVRFDAAFRGRLVVRPGSRRTNRRHALKHRWDTVFGNFPSILLDFTLLDIIYMRTNINLITSCPHMNFVPKNYFAVEYEAVI